MQQDLLRLVQKSSQIDTFSKEFLDTYLQQGFGSMTKHDFELLIYHLLANKTDLLENKSTYEISNLLSLTENKIKNIQLESYLKYEHKNHKSCIDKVISEIQAANIKPELDGNKVKFTLDNPILKRELEHAIKKIGYNVDYSFNKDIVSINIISFISSLKMTYPRKTLSIENKITNSVKQSFKQEKEIFKKINKLTLPEILSKYSGKLASKAIDISPNLISLLGVLNLVKS